MQLGLVSDLYGHVTPSSVDFEVETGIIADERALHCPLCDDGQIRPFFTEDDAEYLRCACALVFVPPVYYLTACGTAEYDLHQNEVDDQGYAGFLVPPGTPLLERLPPGARGLDFGCGPGPALAQCCGGGCQMQLYDSFYYPEAVLSWSILILLVPPRWLSICISPACELLQLVAANRCPAVVGIMTKLVLDAQAFAGWHYKNDPTHVCFFSEQTWHWWAQRQDAEAGNIGADVMLLTR